MNQMAQNVCDFIDLKGEKYEVVDDRTIRFSYRGENMPAIHINLRFDEDGKSASLLCYSIAKIKDDNVFSKAKAQAVCNDLNLRWRWTRFFIDTDDEFTAACDAVIDTYTAGEECLELVNRVASIIDDSYPLIMQSVWA